MRRRIRRFKFKIYILIITIIMVLVGINIHMVNSSEDRIITKNQYKNLNKIDCIIILGSGMNGEKPTPILEARIKKGLELYNLNITNKILVSGDHGKVEHDEVNLMKDYLINKGVPSKNIFMDHAGFSTYETMYRAKEIFKVKRTVIVTQKYHMYRSLYIAEKLGIDAYGIITNYKKYNNYEFRELREFLARDKDFFKVIVKPKPKCLGETIPITGNGNLTNDKNIKEVE